MNYGTLKLDTIVYTSGGFDSSINVSGLAAGNFTNISASGTISGTSGIFTVVSGTSGIFTGTVSGQNIQSSTGVFSFVSGQTITGSGVSDSIGNVRNIPQNSQTNSYTLVASDAGKHVFTTSGVTVPSGVFVIGQAVSIYNNTTGNITITQGSNVTLRQAGASGTGNRTLAQRGIATVLCVSGVNGTEFVIAGNIT